MVQNIEKLLIEMTLEEKASLCSGLNFWMLKGIERLNIPEIMLTDGPHGLRKQDGAADHLGINQSVKSTCFPPAVTSASSWNEENLFKMGEAIAEECIQEDVAVVLGPGVNIKRSPLCGRNFEYFSEDPYLSGKLAAAWINGVQSRNIGTSLKHYACNSQEKARMTGNSVLDNRALREIYLKAFEMAVKESQPATVMCAYNRINGTYACENEFLLNDVLREEWKYEGLVVTDWGAMDERVDSLKAGLEIEMPGPSELNDNKIITAIKNGELDESVLDNAVRKILKLILSYERDESFKYDVENHHKIAHDIAGESTVLLKNDNILPIDKTKSFAVLGAFGETPRYQGAGSSKINPHKIDTPNEELKRLGIDFKYAKGYNLDSDEVDINLIDEAVELAKGNDGAIIFVGLPDRYESEGFDRTHIDLPKNHNILIEKVLEVNKNVIVVLMCGSPVVMPWKNDVSAILISYLGGEAVGSAIADVLTGKVNPSGKLAETFPLKLEDTPSFEYFAKDELNVEYRESIFVGYRYYDWANKEVAFPFGYGLSYTNFNFDKMSVNFDDKTKTGSIIVQITNIGDVPGYETVQLYIGKENTRLLRAPKELKGFKKVYLMPQETKTVELALDKDSFTYYDTNTNDWSIESGEYQLYIGSSSRDIKLKENISLTGVEISEKQITIESAYKSKEIFVNGEFKPTLEQFKVLLDAEDKFLDENGAFSMNSRVKTVLENDLGQKLLGPYIEKARAFFGGADDIAVMMTAMLDDMPLRSLASFTIIDRETLENIINEIN